MKRFRKFLSESQVRTYLKSIEKLQGMSGVKGKNVINDIMLKYGRVYKPNKNTYRGKRDEMKQCFANAGKLALFNSKYTYVEGYVICVGVPLHHAWVIDKSGNLIDTTLKDGKNISEYYGVPIKTEFLRKTVLKSKVWGVLDYWNYDLLKDIDPKEIVA